jgi:tetratricopeptide (TPR) repeat protein
MIPSFNLSFVTIRRAVLGLAVILVAGCSSPEEQAQSYYERGMQHLSKQDYVKAGIEFKNALQKKKDLIGAWRGLLEVETHNRNIQGMVPILRTIVELDPKDLDSKLKLGHFLLLGNALDQALDLANAAIALDGRNPKALAFKASVLLRLKDGIGAKREAQAAVDIDPANAEALIILASERMAAGDTEGALLILDRPGLHFKTEDEFAIQLLKLQIFEKSGDLKQQEALLRKFIDLYPLESAPRKSLINLYVKQKRYDDAEKELRAFAAANPSDLVAGLNVVLFLQQIKGPVAARQELMARINAGGQAFQYQLALAEFDLAQGRIADSIQLLENLVSSARSPEDKLAAQVKLAQIQFRQKKFDVAEALVSSVLRKDNRNIDGLKLRAAIRLQQGQLDAAIVDLRRALDDQPRSSELMILLANAYENSGSIELAEKQYADATKTSGLDVGVSLNYVAFLKRRGNVERAEDLLTQLARQWPNNVAVLSTLADVRLARQNWIGAQEIAETIRRIGNVGGLSGQIQAAALSGQGKYGDSIRILEGLQAAAPAAVQPMTTLVNTLVRAQKLDKAVSFLQTVLTTNPANAEAHVLLGSVQLLKNAPDQAVQSFRTAIERQPKDMVGYSALAEFYVRNKNLDEAERVIRASLQEQPDSFAMHLTYASVLEQKGDYEAAIAEYEILLKQDPGSLIAANNLASLLSDQHTDKASLERAYSLAAILRKSQIPNFKDTLGWIEYLRGDYKSATGLLEEAAAALPNQAWVQYHLGMSYVATGQIGKASEQFKKALALAPDSSLQEKIRAAQKKAAM